MSDFLQLFFSGSFVLQILARACLYAYLGLAFTILYHGGFINLALSAQLILGSVAAGFMGYWTGSITAAIASAFMVCFCIVAAAIRLKCRYHANEVLITLFFTFASIPIAQVLMGSFSGGLTIGTPPIDLGSRLAAARILFGLNAAHLLVVPTAAFVWFGLRYSITGQHLTVIGYNPLCVQPRSRVRVLDTAAWVSSACVTMVIFADMYLYKGRYIQGDYDLMGFIGVVVAMLAGSRIYYILVAALLVSTIEGVFLALKVLFNVPQMGAQIVYGVFLIGSALLLNARPSARDA